MNAFAITVLLNAAVASGMAGVLWRLAMFPAVYRRPTLRHWLWAIVLLKFVTPPAFELSVFPETVDFVVARGTRTRLFGENGEGGSAVDGRITVVTQFDPGTRMPGDWFDLRTRLEIGAPVRTQR